MRKIILLVLILSLSITSFAFAENELDNVNFILKLGLDTVGEIEGEVLGFSATEDVDMGFSLSAELINKVNNNWDAGIGITFMSGREIEDFSGEFYFIPMYGLIRLHPVPAESNAYIIGQLGFNMFEGDSTLKGNASLSGGMYYGIGAGLIIQEKTQIEMLFSHNEGEAALYNLTADISYTTLTFSLGHIF